MCLIPEVPFTFEKLIAQVKKVLEAKNYAVVCVAEGEWGQGGMWGEGGGGWLHDGSEGVVEGDARGRALVLEVANCSYALPG